MQKIKTQLHPEEVQALFQLINRADFNLIPDADMRIMCKHIVEGIYFKLARRLLRKDGKPSSLTLKPAEAAAMRQVLHTYDLLDLGDYERNLLMRLSGMIDQKLLG